MTVTDLAGLQPFHAMEILAEAKGLEAEGREIFHLEVGEPGVPPAPVVRAAVNAALDAPQRYTHAKGLLPLRQRLARHYAQEHDVSVDPENIIVTVGSSAGFILAFLAGFAPGARIAVTRPGYPAYLNILTALGFHPVEIALSAETGWILTTAALEAAHADTPFQGLLFASPANPTGAAVSASEMAQIVATCDRLDVTLISDEIYHGLDYRGASASALETSGRAIVVNSFSKYHCMTGWRIGWLILPQTFLRRAEILQQNMFISSPSLSQVAGLAALDARPYAETQKAHYAQNRVLLAQGLKSLGFTGEMGQGAFYHYVDISRFSNDSLAFCRAMLRQAGVAATPGVDFDRVDGNRFVRFSYAGTTDDIANALEHIARFIA